MTHPRSARALVSLLGAVIVLLVFAVAAQAAPPAPTLGLPASGTVATATPQVFLMDGIPGATESIYLDGVLDSTVAISDSGYGNSHLHTALENSTQHTITVTQTTDDGESAPSDPHVIDVRLDPPTLASPVDGGAVPTSTGPFEITGGFADGEVAVFVDGGFAMAALLDDQGHVTANLDDQSPLHRLGVGSHTIRVTNVDGSFNLGDNSTPTVSFDYLPVPVFVSPIDGGLTNPDEEYGQVHFAGANPGDTIELEVDGAPTTTGVADADGTGTIVPPTGTAGQHTYQLADPAYGHLLDGALIDVTFDFAQPDAPTLVSPAQDSVDVAPSVQFAVSQSEPDSIVELYVDDAPVGSAVTGEDGSTTITPDAPLSDGLHLAYVVSTDAAGNPSDPSNTNQFTVDAIAPVTPTIDSPADHSFLSASPLTTTISGAEPGTTVTATFDGDGGPTGTATVDPDGTATVTFDGLLSDGDHTESVVSTDAAGNESPAASATITVDTDAPDAPTLDTPTDQSYSVTPDTTDITYTANEAHASIVFAVDDEAPVTIAADDDGVATYLWVQSSEGDHTISARVTDRAGNVGPSSPTTTFTVDTVAPAAPTIVAPADEGLVNDASPTLQYTAEPGTSVTFFVDDDVAGTATADENGNAQVTAADPLIDGVHHATAQATDLADNVGEMSATTSFTVDTIAPDVPVAISPANGATITTATPTLRYAAEPGSIVSFSVDGHDLGTATADGDGTASLDVTSPLRQGDNPASAMATDAAGNQSAPSQDSFTVNVDAPTVPTMTAPTDGEGAVRSSATIAINADPGVDVTLTLDGDGDNALAQTADQDGNTTFDFGMLADGEHSVDVAATSNPDNTSTIGHYTFTVDAVSPATPTLTSPGPSSHTSASTPYTVTDAEPDSTVTLLIDESVAGHADADSAGNATITLDGPLDDGDHTASVTATDAAGNVSDESAAISFTLDTIAPGAPTIDAPGDGAIINDATPMVVYHAEAGTTVELFIDDASVATAVADPDGVATLALSTDLTAAEHHVKARADDASANASDFSDVTAFTVDTTAPDAPTLTTPADGSSLNRTDVDFTFHTEPGARVDLTIDGVFAQTTSTADGSGDVTFTGFSSAEGHHTLEVTATDAAGSRGPSGDYGYTVDTAKPARPTLASPSDGDVTDADTVFSVADAEPGATVTLYIDGLANGQTSADAATVQIVPVDALTDGAHIAYVVSTDTAGNDSDPSASVSFTSDTTPPSAPVLVAPVADGYASSAIGPFEYTTEPGGTVEFVIDGLSAGTAIADGDGLASFHLVDPLSEGPHTLRARSTDGVGNVGVLSAETAFTVNSSVPAVPVLTSPLDASSTTDASGHLTFSADPASVVSVTFDGGAAQHATANSDGNVAFDEGALPDGHHTILVEAANIAGNTSETAHDGFTVDTSAPSPPTVTPPVGTTPDDVPSFAFTTTEPNEVVTFSIDGVVVGTASSDGDGHGVFRLGRALSAGSHTVSATAADSAGNISAAFAPMSFTVAAVPAPTPVGPGVPSPAPAPAPAPPPGFVISNVALSGHVLSTCAKSARHCHERTVTVGFHVNMSAIVHLTLKHRIAGKYVTVAVVDIKARTGSASYVLHRSLGGKTLHVTVKGAGYVVHRRMLRPALAVGAYQVIISGPTPATYTQPLTVK